jgi:aspartate aminotransferase
MTKVTSRVPLSRFASEVAHSGIREIFNATTGRKDVYHLEVGQPDFPTPAHVIEAAFKSAREWSGYTHSAGLKPLREAISERLRRVHDLDYSPDELVVTHGGVHAIAAVATATIEPGDEVLVPDPGWPNYAMIATALGGRVVPYPLRAEDDFVPDPDRVAALFTDKTKLIVLNSPANPTGAVIPAEIHEAIVNACRDAGVLVISDEVYDEIYFDGDAAPTAVRYDKDWVVGVWSCSKTYAMTGWRVGYLAAGPQLVDTIVKLQEPTISSVSSVTQAAAHAALTGPQDVVVEMCSAYRHRRDLVADLLRDAGIDSVVPRGAFYQMVPLQPGTDSRMAALDLVKRGVAVAPGSAFGRVAADQLRLSLASSEEALRGGVERILDWYESQQH